MKTEPTSLPGHRSGRFQSISKRTALAFSLIELLVVIAIIAVLMTLAIPAVQSISGASHLTTGASLIADQLELARQTALSKNQVVEVRFYKLPAEIGDKLAFRAIQLFTFSEPWRDSDGNFVTDERLAVAVTSIQRLPLGIIMLDEQKYSTLLNDISNPRPLKTALVPGMTAPSIYQYIRFAPNGSTDLNPNGAPSDPWFLTLKSENAPTRSDRPADNFVTTMLDPVSGRTQIFRP